MGGKKRRILTGTAAIKVGLRTEQSPLLPFFILVDYRNKKKNILNSCHTFTVHPHVIVHPQKLVGT